MEDINTIINYDMAFDFDLLTADSLLNPFLFTTLCFLTLRQLSVLGKKLVDFWPLIEKKRKTKKLFIKSYFCACFIINKE